MMEKRVVFNLYILILKEKRTIDSLAVFPGNEDTKGFAFSLGHHWWEDREWYIDERYVRVEEYIESCGK